MGAWTKLVVTDEEYSLFTKHNVGITPRGALVPNEGVEVYSETGECTYGVYDAYMKKVRVIRTSNPIFDSFPNKDLMLFNDHLNNPNVSTLVVDGLFGTGKTSTVMSVVVGSLMKEIGLNSPKYKGFKPPKCSKLTITKPHVSLGNSYGHLPGSINDKIQHEFESYLQYFERFGNSKLAYILGGQLPLKTVNGSDVFVSEKLLTTQVFEYIRGVDFDHGWVVLDEAQNASAKELYSLVSRCNDNVKLIVIGDSSPLQLDRKGGSNGMALANEMLNGRPYAATIKLDTPNHIVRGKRVRDLYKYMMNS